MKRILTPAVLALLACTFTARAVTPSPLSLSPLSAQTQTFAAGRDLQPVTISPDGQKLLTYDASGLTLWQTSPLRALWRVSRLLKWFPAQTTWTAQTITLLGIQGQKVNLSIRDGKEEPQSKDAATAIPEAVQQALGLPLALTEGGALYQLGRGLWQSDPKNPIPFEIGGGKLLGFYAQQAGLLALKRPDYAPIELWQGGKLTRRLDTAFPARGLSGLDNRYTENLSFSPDGHWLAWSASGRVSIWDTRSGQKVALLRPDPYGQQFEQLQVVWLPDSTALSAYSTRGLWRYGVTATGTFASKGQTPVPQGALIRVAAADGTLTSGTGSALLLSRPSSAAQSEVVTVGPVPQAAFFGDDGQTRIMVSWPTLWVFGPKRPEPLTVQLPSYAEASYITLKGDLLSIYGRNLSWTPGQESTMQPSIWTSNLAAAQEGQTLALTLQQEDKRPNCATDSGQWLSSVLTPVRLCRQGQTLSGYQADKVLWTLTADASTSLTLSPDGRWFALQNPSTLKIFRSENGMALSTLTLPKAGSEMYWSPILRVDETGRWAVLQSGTDWYMADLKSGAVTLAPQLKGAQDVSFVAGKLAVIQTDKLLWFGLK